MLRKLWQRLTARRAPKARAGRSASASSDRPAIPDSASPPDRLIVGLGNPGGQYEATRHNVGFRVVEALAQSHDGTWEVDTGLDARVARIVVNARDCLLVEPQTFMNRSGTSVRAACDRWPSLDPSREVLVVFDDLDLPLGRLRMRPSGGAGGHRGMADILDALQTREVARLRFGIGHPGPGGAVVDWVLGAFSPGDAPALEGAIPRACQAIETFVQDGLEAARRQFNADP